MARTKTESLNLVAPEFQAEFVRFTQTGEASQEFLDFLRSDRDCQEALERDFAEKVQVYREAVQEFRDELTLTLTGIETASPGGDDWTTCGAREGRAPPSR